MGKFRVWGTGLNLRGNDKFFIKNWKIENLKY